MMGKQSEQIQMVILDIDSMIPDTHLLRRIKKDLLTNSDEIFAVLPDINQILSTLSQIRKQTFSPTTFIQVYSSTYSVSENDAKMILYIPFQVNHLHGQTEPVPRRMRATLTETEPMLFYANYQATAC
ncbi:MAG: hypothetical protein ACLTF1_04950 [Clostridium sp.]